MANLNICTVENCGKFIHAKGLCQTHYGRMRRYGNPLARMTSPLDYLHNTVLPYKGADCLIWPFGRSGVGYAMLRTDGRMRNVHRLVCEQVHGPAPTDAHQSAHSCGKRACVNPQHLQWKTPAANQADRIIHNTSNRGERHGHSKLTKALIYAIREACGTQREIAARFGVHQVTVSKIKLGRRWQHI